MKYLLIMLLCLPVITKAQDPELIYAQKQLQQKDTVKSNSAIESIPFSYNDSGEVEFTEVVKVDSVNAQELYSRAKLFIAKSYVNNKAVSQLNDDAGKIVLINPIMNVTTGSIWVKDNLFSLNYQLTIQCKDGRYKYTIGRFYYMDQYGIPQSRFNPKEDRRIVLSKKNMYNLCNSCYNNSQNLITELKQFMAASKGADW